jgi:hypothetical protein
MQSVLKHYREIWYILLPHILADFTSFGSRSAEASSNAGLCSRVAKTSLQYWMFRIGHCCFSGDHSRLTGRPLSPSSQHCSAAAASQLSVTAENHSSSGGGGGGGQGRPLFEPSSSLDSAPRTCFCGFYTEVLYRRCCWSGLCLFGFGFDF